MLFAGRLDRSYQGIVSALRQRGSTVQILDYQDIRYRKVFSRNAYKRWKALFRLARTNSRVRKSVRKNQPEVFFAMGGNTLLPSTLLWLREKGIILVLWLLDPIYKLPLTEKGFPFYHFIYTFEPDDIKRIAPANPQVAYLPPAFDPSVNYPIPSYPKVHDLVFVGNPWDRLPFLEELAAWSLSRNLQLSLVGRYWRKGNPLRGKKFRKEYPAIFSSVQKNGVMAPIQVNRLYNQTRIALNIHLTRSVEGVNPRLFEIAGSGAFQLVDEKKTLPGLFLLGKEMVTFNGIEDLSSRIAYYLESPKAREEIAGAARSRARNDHTYFQRLGKIIRDLQT